MQNILLKIICLTTIVLFDLSASAQPMDVSFSYDESGNRILREKLYLPESSLNVGDSAQTFTDETITPSERTDAALSSIAGQDVYLYPNPTRGQVQVELGSFNTESDAGDCMLVSQKGEMLMQSETLEKELQLDLGK